MMLDFNDDIHAYTVAEVVYVRTKLHMVKNKYSITARLHTSRSIQNIYYGCYLWFTILNVLNVAN